MLIYAALSSALGIWGLCRYLPFDLTVPHRTVLLLLWGVFAYLGRSCLRQNRRARRFGLALGAWYVLSQLAGERLGMAGTIAGQGADFLYLAVAVLGLMPGLGGLFAQFLVAMERAKNAPRKAYRFKPATVFFGCAAILLLCWLPVFLAFYPGLFTYDVSWQYLMYQTGEFSTHHPLLHTLLIGGLMDFGRSVLGYPVKGIVLYSLLQMGLMALAHANAIRFLYQKRAPKWLCLGMLALGCVMPFHSLLAISTTKDTLFAGAVMTLCVMLADCVLEPEKLRKPWWLLGFVLCGMMVGMLRNNGFVCLLAVCAIGLFALMIRRGQGKRLIALGLAALALSSLGKSALQAVTGAEDGAMSEMLSVPVQQLARAYVLTEDERKPEIVGYLSNAAAYAPTISDPVKNPFTPEASDLPGFLRLWLDVGLRHPVVYLDAFGALTRGFYHLDEMPAGCYLDASFHDDEAAWILEDSKWPWLKEEMTRLYHHNGFLEIPLFSTVLSTAFWCRAMLLAFFFAFYVRSRAGIASGAMAVALFLSTLLGPCVMLRYIYPMILSAPLLLGVSLVQKS